MNINNIIYGGYERIRARRKTQRELKHIKDIRYCKIADTYILSEDNKKAIDEFYLTNYGNKIPYTWHKYYSAHSGVFDCRYFPDLLLRPYFEHYINLNRNYAFVFEDKNVLPYIASSADVKMPKTILSRTCGIMRDGDSRIVSDREAQDILTSNGEVFCKSSTGSYGGKGCFVADFNVIKEPVKEVLDDLGSDFVIQEKIVCHKSIASIYPKSVNTFRVITYRWKEDFIQLPVFMRVGQGGNVVDNGAAGGMFLGVHDDGSLTDKAVMPYNTCILSHPDTGFVFKGHRIEHFEKVCDAAKRMHGMMPMVGMVYWDFTIDKEGEPILIECNIFSGTIYAIQMTHGVPAFGDRTAEVLQWIRKMKHTPYSKRGDYAFGNM